MGGRCERIAGTEQLMGWHREGVQLARTENNATHWVPPGGSVSGFVVWRRRDWGEEVDGRGVDGRVAGANRRHRAANRVTSGGCAARPPRTCAAALTRAIRSYMVLHQMEYGNRYGQRGEGGVEVDGRVAGANRRHRAANRVISGGCAARPPRMCAVALTQTIRSYMVLHQMEHGNGAETTMVNPSLGQRALWRRVAAGLGTLRGRTCPTKLTGSGAPPAGPVVDQRSPQVLTSIYGPCKEIWPLQFLGQ